MKILRFIIIATCILTFSYCSSPQHDSRLLKAKELIDSIPKVALDSLVALDVASLSEADRHYLDFLSIKAVDKAFITHTSDSLILDVIDYAESHRSHGYYPEALYYGGRVYSDLGDYHTALSYFQQALDLLPKNAEDQDLRSRIISQTASLLDELRLYDEAIPYVKESIEISRQLNDTLGEVLDLQLLGVINLRANNLIEADSSFRLALTKCEKLPSSYDAQSRTYIADVKYKLGQFDSALIYIRNTYDVVTPIAQNNVLAYSAEIYMKNCIYDSAYMYAHELINSANGLNKETGYSVIFSDSVRKYANIDSLIKYATDYHASLEHSSNEHEAQLAINQQSLHNYSLHKRERDKADNKNRILGNCLFIGLFVLLILVVVILSLKNHNKKNVIELRTALQNIEKLEQSLGQFHTETPEDSTDTAEQLREKLRTKLYSIYESNNDSKEIPLELLQSEAYKNLLKMISEGKELKDFDRLWTELEETLSKCSPKFRENLQLLVGGKLSSYDLHTAILIKYGVTPTQMAVLLNRSKGTISSRRESLSIRIFDKKIGVRVIDGIIRLL